MGDGSGHFLVFLCIGRWVVGEECGGGGGGGGGRGRGGGGVCQRICLRATS